MRRESHQQFIFIFIAMARKKIFIFIRCQESRTNSLSLSLSGAERVVSVSAKGELPIGASAEANQGFVLKILCFHIFARRRWRSKFAPGVVLTGLEVATVATMAEKQSQALCLVFKRSQ